MTKSRRGPKPVVEYDGQTYSARKYDIEVPDLDSLSRLEALVWLNQYTCKRGHSTKAPEPNLRGLTVVVR
ncbi:hypothetical protein [Mycobacteroides abscessus]|uniref:hypothetical protein n=1 Tax=Mycobacteroides abscessus TaxID=36809 RepID=UPI000925BF83|nr:hypothetical protein [Mycobacteroides abscessus]SIC87104.1 Uncharacterised protein [Mycobacteroides abscessus subsp. bolletii]SKT75511.1 Uncharacterised protein [Mycobacteroides abscessus subsp. bolletii]SLD35393.1 Uncharacterised protein [Mycobacteroides abscessus subsp. bolletii]SLF79465.1 Uncharacterised protein [Mycobacteroides abscessus subsp. bolletii]